MEIDFSEKIIQHNAAVNLQNSTGRSGPKSAAQTPARRRSAEDYFEPFQNLAIISVINEDIILVNPIR